MMNSGLIFSVFFAEKAPDHEWDFSFFQRLRIRRFVRQYLIDPPCRDFCSNCSGVRRRNRGGPAPHEKDQQPSYSSGAQKKSGHLADAPSRGDNLRILVHQQHNVAAQRSGSPQMWLCPESIIARA
jgi:hypothetical protein